MNQIGIVGGIAGFYSSIIMVVVGYFAEIDYFATVIKKLYLDERSDSKFFAKFLNDCAKCASGHAMKLTTTAKPRSKSKDGINTDCDKCGKKLFLLQGYYTCTRPCNNDLCHDCYQSNTADRTRKKKKCC